MKRMLFNATHAEETRVGIVDGQKLIDIDIETVGREARKSNIYRGVVTRIEPSLEACFVNYGEERHGFLPFKEISRAYFKEGIDVRAATIREAITEGQELIVQVEKEERGNKGAALTTFISLAGRYLVLMPNNPRGGGVSRRIEGEERQELREAMEKLDLPNGMSTIARTAGIGRTTEELQWDLNYLLKLWEAISDASEPQYELIRDENGRKVQTIVKTPVADGKPLKRINPPPYLIVEESNLVVRAIRDYFQPDIGEILVDTDEIYDQARQFMAHVMPDMVGRVKRYREDIPLFTRFQIEHQIETAYSRTVPLPSGGAIVIDHTEALVAVDVNSARATRGADIEETAFRTNCEAADEVARQMRLRDLGGLIVIDFIDMADAKNQRAVEQRLKDALRYDRARVQMAKISRFGLMELSRQRLRPALSEGNHVTCPRCNGVGVIRDTESCALQVLRILQEEAMKEGTGAVHAQVPVDVATFLLNEKRNDITKLEARHRVPIVLIPNTHLETPHYHIERLRQDDDRLDDTTPSFNRAEDLEAAVADDPYALKSQENKPQRPKQVPVIKNVIDREPAPVHVPAAKPESENKAVTLQPVTEKKGLFARIAEFFFGSDEKKAEEKAEKTADKDGKKEERNDKRRSRRNDGRRMRRGERPERAERKDRAEQPERTEERQEEKKPRRERPARRQAEPAVDLQKEQTEAVETAEKTSRRRSRRRRPAEEPQQPAAEAAVVETAVTEVTDVPAPAETPAPVETVKTETEAESAEVRPESEDAADDAQNETRRRPRRRRRTKAGAGEQPTDADNADLQDAAEAQPAVDAAVEPAETVQAPEAAPVVESEPAVQPSVETMTPAAEVKAEPETPAVAPAPAAVEPKAEESGLIQIETTAKAEPSDYAAEKPLGRKPVVRTEEAESEPLVQIETKRVEDDAADLKSAAHMADVAHQITESFEKADRRPRRSRRGRKNEETVKTALKPIAEAVAEIVAEASPIVKAVEPQAPKAEEHPVEAAVETVETTVAAVEEAVAETPAVPAADDVASGLEENLRRAGLVQVHTTPELVTYKGYETVVYAGRPTVKAAAADEAEVLEQVHTRPELCRPVVYEAVKYPGRPYTAPAAADEGELIQVHTKA